ncbi:hypothetical protein ABI59_13465 [Acidobacteria bacterium Mor1]|nr:hypothetical protein ABI59_13465 [Acidobacteria bacterium Mor1]
MDPSTLIAWTGDQAVLPWFDVAILGPVLFAILAGVVLLLSLVRRERYRVVGVFGDADREAVRTALVEAEKRTVAEILPVVVERSDPHPAARWLAGVLTAVVFSMCFAAWLPWEWPAVVFAGQFLAGAAGYLLAGTLPYFQRLFIGEKRATAVVEEQAFQEFYRNGLHRTEAATGVLLFISLLERRVVVFADEGIDSVVDDTFWRDVDDKVLEGIRAGSIRDGLIGGIQRVAELVEQPFPWKPGDRNEVPDRVIIRSE